MKNHKIKLIDNTYSKEEAKDLLLALLNDKIKFLQMKIFSLQERMGADTHHLEKRVDELKEEKTQLLSKIKELGEKEYAVDIDCHVYLKVHHKESVLV
jgi:hypothetical protein